MPCGCNSASSGMSLRNAISSPFGPRKFDIPGLRRNLGNRDPTLYVNLIQGTQYFGCGCTSKGLLPNCPAKRASRIQARATEDSGIGSTIAKSATTSRISSGAIKSPIPSFINTSTSSRVMEKSMGNTGSSISGNKYLTPTKYRQQSTLRCVSNSTSSPLVSQNETVFEPTANSTFMYTPTSPILAHSQLGNSTSYFQF